MGKAETNRREFMQLTGGLLCAASPWSTALAAGSAYPDMVVYNAKVYTADEAIPFAQALAVKNGRFVAIGRNDETRNWAGPATRLVDAGGATIVPGFHDAHLHADGKALLGEVLVGNPFDVEFLSIAEIIDRLRRRAAETPPGEWVTGYFYDDTKSKDGRPLTRLDLDQVSRVHPVRLRHRGAHTSYYNSHAFDLAGITKDTPNPPGGEFFHDARGLSGRVAENANAVFEAVGKKSALTEAQSTERDCAGAEAFSKAAVKLGITSVQASTWQVSDLRALQSIRASGKLLHRVNYEVAGTLLEAMIANGIRSGFGDEWIRLGATSEYLVDGSFSERTARLAAPYPGTKPPYYGIMTRPQEDLDAWCERVHRAGIRLNCHANGDAGIDAVLTAYERTLGKHPNPKARPKITHATIVNPDLLRRMKAIDAVPAAFTTYTYYNSDKFHYYGAQTMERAMAFRSFLDAGIPAAAGSDYGAGPLNPLMGIQGIVTRKGWDGKVWGASQRVSVAEAIRIYTLNGAYAAREETDKGSIAPGKLADFVLLSEDPHAVPHESIREIKVLSTYTDGRLVYEA